MSKVSANPLLYANQSMNKLMFGHGLFTYVDRLYAAVYLRKKMQRREGVELVQRINDTHREISSVWYVKEADAYIMLREFNCRARLDCYANHGDLSITAKTHEGLALATALCQSHDDTDVDKFFADEEEHEF